MSKEQKKQIGKTIKSQYRDGTRIAPVTALKNKIATQQQRIAELEEKIAELEERLSVYGVMTN